MARIRQNGGFVGKINNTTTSGASGIFGPNELQYRRLGGLWPNATAAALIPDEYFEYTTLLLPGNGTNGAQNNTFLDGSTNNFTITRNGNTTQGTFSPFSQTGWGNYCSGDGNYLSLAPGAAFAFGTGDFTVECFSYVTGFPAVPNSIYLVDSRNSGQTGTWAFLTGADGTNPSRLDWFNGSTIVTSASINLTANKWQHLVYTRLGTTFGLFIDGVRVATGTDNTNYSVSPTISYIASRFNATGSLTGYISNLRIVKGSSVYSPSNTTLTVPTAPLTAISGTSLLTCQSNRFRDASSNNFTITPNGSPSVVAFSPFNPTASWSAATNGGSGYFDGTGDTISAPNNAAFDFGSGDFTLEFWFYPTAQGQSGYTALLSKFSSSANYAPFSIVQKPSSYDIALSASSTGSSWNLSNGITSNFGTMIPNAWNHIAVAREGTNCRCFLNGSLNQTSNFSTTALMTNSDPVYIGSGNAANSYGTGYIGSLRIVKGTAVYTSAFTPPTEPLTAITNTSLLLNFTNAGIYDATSKNDLETVGNAQISTAQSKFGGSSMYFDGTGDYLTSNPATTDMYAFGGGDFTIEMWILWNSLIGTQIFYDQRPLAGGVYPTLYMSGTTLIYYTNGANRITGSTLSTGQWYHIAVARSGTSTKLFVGGVQSGSTYTDSNVYLNATLRPFIGGDGTNIGASINAYMQDVRVTKGYARYTANFTAPTAAFPTL